MFFMIYTSERLLLNAPRAKPDNLGHQEIYNAWVDFFMTLALIESW